ncbi:hypothetical protein [Methylocapsa palsarum]|uniref:Uncharacterized protein n=1 Tax=Methylocapsa palsarum TaxID=1612308 RepID=A0A1I3ZAC9_9HYPH|nr:hypothetical protein [Methylocapsa palsarum]SFK41017.1 hypothetical protein SAMN05444581_107196 [Methylocapsa palsarum]
MLRHRTIAVIAVAAVSMAATAAMTRAADPLSAAVMTPMQGISFDIGTKRAVSYFLSDADACQLTVTLAETRGDNVVNSATAMRMTVAVEPGKVAHLDTAAGKGLDFKCQAGAKQMNVNESDLAAY